MQPSLPYTMHFLGACRFGVLHLFIFLYLFYYYKNEKCRLYQTVELVLCDKKVVMVQIPLLYYQICIPIIELLQKA